MPPITDFPLIDRLYQMTYGKPVEEWQSNKRMRRALTEAHRFVLDPAMSSFLADIAFAVCSKRGLAITAQSIDFARRGARLPHDVTWIEFDCQRYAQREIELGGELLNFEPPDNETYLREGWLLNGHNSDADGFRLHLFHDLIRDGKSIIRACPLVVTWRTNADPCSFFGDDTWKTTTHFLASIAVGASSFVARDVEIGSGELVTMPPTFPKPGEVVPAKALTSYGYMTGLLRRVWTLLATINETPVGFSHPTASPGGFTAKLRHHRFLEHRTVTIELPATHGGKRALARAVVAASKRRWHMVRGHWRNIPNRQIWIGEHARGDASLGVIVHDYAVTH